MNQSSAATLFRSALSPQAREAAKQKLALRGLSLSGVVLLLVSLSVFASGSMSMRPHIFGLAVHLYLLPVAVAFPFLVLSRIAVFPPRILAMLTFLTGIYCFSVLSGAGMSLSEIFKMVSAPITIITYALLVRRQGDFVAGTLGLCIAVALLAAKAFASPDHGVSGMVVMEGVANKNSYSMYALPAILLGGYIVLNMKVSMVVKVAIYASSAIAAAAVRPMSCIANDRLFSGVRRIGLIFAVPLQWSTGNLISGGDGMHLKAYNSNCHWDTNPQLGVLYDRRGRTEAIFTGDIIWDGGDDDGAFDNHIYIANLLEVLCADRYFVNQTGWSRT